MVNLFKVSNRLFYGALALVLLVAFFLLSIGIAPTVVSYGKQFSSAPTRLEKGAGNLAMEPLQPIRSQSASGPLRVSQENPRYFVDGNGKVILLTGSHTWSNLVDNGGSFPPPQFDYPAFLEFLQTNNHNFFRLWSWEQTRWTLETTDNNYWFDPLPFERTGPGNALDGQPKFDLTKLNQAYFDRMRSRVIAAGDQGIYVAIVLYNGWSVASAKGGFADNNPWRGHPFNVDNNINGIDGDKNNDNSGEETHELGDAQITALQEAYVRKVIDTVNDLDNVLYEISNESHSNSQEWQYHMINFIKDYESTKPKQHPVGMTVEYPGGDNNELYNSPADWISPNGDINNRPPTDGRKVVIADSDHLCGVCGDRTFVWKSFTAGENPIFMDGYDGEGYGVGGVGFNFDDPTWVSLRLNMGYALTFSNRMDLSKVRPLPNLASTGYVLANPSSTGAEYLVFLPSGGSVNVNLSGTTGEFKVEWFEPGTGETTLGTAVNGGSNITLQSPLSGDAVLYLYQQNTSSPTATSPPDPTLSPSPTSTVEYAPTPTDYTPTVSPTSPANWFCPSSRSITARFFMPNSISISSVTGELRELDKNALTLLYLPLVSYCSP